MRHFNQDPLEIFLALYVRTGAEIGISPTPGAFESAFTSLLINNLTGNHSLRSNCAEDECKIFQSMECLLEHEDLRQIQINSIDYDDLECEIDDYEVKKADCRIMGQLSSVAGYVLSKAKRLVFENCAKCKDLLYQEDNEYILK